jgi:hypothetical protein
VTPDDFRRLALSLDGVEEGSHHGVADFRVGGHIFATLASADQGLGNLLLTADEQAILVEELPEAFFAIKGGWGRMGMTHVRLGIVDEEVLLGALQTAWRIRQAKNARARKKAPVPTRRKPKTPRPRRPRATRTK